MGNLWESFAFKIPCHFCLPQPFSTPLNHFIYSKSKSPCPSAEAGLSNEYFPKVEKLLGRAVTVAETSSVVTNAAATSANDCTWAFWEVQRFGPTDFCKSKACQHKSAIYFSAVLKSLVLDSSCHDTSTFRPKEPLICRVSANCGSPKHMDSSLLNNFYCWRMLLMLLPHTPAIWCHI